MWINYLGCIHYLCLRKEPAKIWGVIKIFSIRREAGGSTKIIVKVSGEGG